MQPGALIAVVFALGAWSASGQPAGWPAEFPEVKGAKVTEIKTLVFTANPTLLPRESRAWDVTMVEDGPATVLATLRAELKARGWKITLDRTPPGDRRVIVAERRPLRVVITAAESRGATNLSVVGWNGTPPEAQELERLCEVYRGAVRRWGKEGKEPSAWLSDELSKVTRRETTHDLRTLLATLAFQSPDEQLKSAQSYALQIVGVVDWCPEVLKFYEKKEKRSE